MATGVSLIVDCNSPAFVFSSGGGSEWTRKQVDVLYKGSSWVAETDNSSFTFLFEGTSVSFIGKTETSRRWSTVQVDNEKAFRSHWDTDTDYKSWFQSTTLSDGKHLVTVSNLSLTDIDFAVVSVGNQTPLSGKTIIVDDDSPSILYSGLWSRHTSQFDANGLGTGYPYGNSTHRSSTPGDYLTFRFTGTSISVYGIFSWNGRGTLSATFTLDGVTTPQTYNATGLLSRESPNFLLYSLDLSPGDHTLIINVTEADNKTFMLDYITYAPSFATLLSASVTNTTSIKASVSSTSLGDPASQPTGLGTSATSHPLPTAAIVGGAIGVVALGVIVTVMGLFLRRRKAKQTENISQYLYAPTERTDGNDEDGNELKQRQGHQQPNGDLSNLPRPAHEFTNVPLSLAPVKFGRSNPAVPLDPHINNPVADLAIEPPPMKPFFALAR